MGMNREYVVPGNGRDITVRLDEATAERLGAKPVKAKQPEAKEAPAPKNKARSADNK